MALGRKGDPRPTLSIRNRDFIAASRETGERTWRIIAFEIIPNEVSLIAASFVNTVLSAIGASVALAFIGLADLSSWSFGTMLYSSPEQQALELGAWWWFTPGIIVALIGISLVLLNTGIDELGNPRLRGREPLQPGRRAEGPAHRPDSRAGSNRSRRGLPAFLHSFSRSAWLEEGMELQDGGPAMRLSRWRLAASSDDRRPARPRPP